MTKIQSRYFLVALAILVAAGLIMTACSSSAPAEATEANAAWNVPVEFAEGTFPTTLSKIRKHTNPWQRKNCFTCHDKEVAGAPPIPHDIYTQSCRQCHVPAEGAGAEY